MEVTTVSPSAISPTEGADLCETDIPSVAIHIVTLLICLCGLAGNGAVLCLLELKICNDGIFTLAVIDFLFLLLTIPFALLSLVEDISCFPVVPLLYLNFLFKLSVLSYYWGLYWLMPNTPVVYMEKIFPLCCRCELPQRLFWVLGSVQYWAFFALFTVLPTVTSLCPSEEQGHCRAALISMYTIILLLFVAPMVISSIIDFIKAKPGSQQQQPKRRDIVTVLIVLLTLLLIICDFLQQLGYLDVPSLVFFLFPCINSSFKPFTYFLAGRCWRPCSVRSLRPSLQRVFEEQKEKSGNTDDPAMDTMI
ncbi:mas-related G-protein coupled receptor member H [Taeniopygia guttata]|uniref:mas-related G-protein coupled receptor member H n=1 Tax=Taeniopygia guttata TaxID=59729 RepID=UPI003BB95618